jgi:4-carboxymuconolactone decarboxylase
MHDRMPPLDTASMNEAQRAVHDRIAAGPRGAVYGPFVPLLRSAELTQHVEALGEYLRYRSILPQRLREFAILVIARHWTQQVEWVLHEPPARAAGVSDETIRALAVGKTPGDLDEPARIVWDFLAQLQQTQRVDDALYARARQEFGEPGVVELSALTGYYTLLAMVMNVAQTVLPDGAAPLAPL